MWLNFQILLVLLLIQFINLLRVAENKIPVQIHFWRYFENANAGTGHAGAAGGRPGEIYQYLISNR